MLQNQQLSLGHSIKRSFTDASEVCMAAHGGLIIEIGLHIPQHATREIVDDTTTRKAVIIGVHNPTWDASRLATDVATSDAIFEAILETNPPL